MTQPISCWRPPRSLAGFTAVRASIRSAWIGSMKPVVSKIDVRLAWPTPRTPECFNSVNLRHDHSGAMADYRRKECHTLHAPSAGVLRRMTGAAAGCGARRSAAKPSRAQTVYNRSR
jgi:hypothetical protein